MTFLHQNKETFLYNNATPRQTFLKICRGESLFSAYQIFVFSDRRGRRSQTDSQAELVRLAPCPYKEKLNFLMRTTRFSDTFYLLMIKLSFFVSCLAGDIDSKLFIKLFVNCRGDYREMRLRHGEHSKAIKCFFGICAGC